MTAPAPWLVRRLQALGLTLMQATSVASGQGVGGGLPADAAEHWAETDPVQTPDSPVYYILWNGDAGPGDTIMDNGDGPTNVVFAGGEEGIYAIWFYVRFADPAQKTMVEVHGPSQIVGSQGTLEPGFGPQTIRGSGAMRLEPGEQMALLTRFHTGPAVAPVLPDIAFAYFAAKRIG